MALISIHEFKQTPGSSSAFERGCTCARIDNHYGKGRYGDSSRYGFFITGGCPLHDRATVRETK